MDISTLLADTVTYRNAGVVTLKQLGCTPVSSSNYSNQTIATRNTTKIQAYLDACSAGTEKRSLHLLGQGWTINSTLVIPQFLVGVHFIGGGGALGDARGEGEAYRALGGRFIWIGALGTNDDYPQGIPMMDCYGSSPVFDYICFQGVATSTRALAVAGNTNYATVGLLVRELATGIEYTGLHFVCCRTGCQMGTAYSYLDNADQLRGRLLTVSFCDKGIHTKNVQSVSCSAQTFIQFNCSYGIYIDGGGLWTIQDVLILGTSTTQWFMSVRGISRNHAKISIGNFKIDGNANDTRTLQVRNQGDGSDTTYLDFSISPVYEDGAALDQYHLRGISRVTINNGYWLKAGMVRFYKDHGDASTTNNTSQVILNSPLFKTGEISHPSSPPTVIADAGNSESGATCIVGYWFPSVPGANSFTYGFIANAGSITGTGSVE